MIGAALESFRAMQDRLLGSDAAYRRGNKEFPIRVVVGRTSFRSQNDSGVWIRTSSHDFIVKADALPFEPEPGDEILHDGLEYEVLAPNGESVSRWSDPHGTAIRIHTKLIGGK